MEQQKKVTSKNWENSSSQVSLTAYDYDTLVMKVTFKASGTYKYESVPHDVWEKSLKATSIGKFINSDIKGKYAYKKI